mmetsp:Transcript_64627/g.148006  ORF Transcript_64627/g.148006 Transcript_64627/m.148006 type:complete len:235 (-) Transcript_64627:426-1130(-)
MPSARRVFSISSRPEVAVPIPQLLMNATAAFWREDVSTSKASMMSNSFPDPYTAGTCEHSDIVATMSAASMRQSFETFHAGKFVALSMMCAMRYLSTLADSLLRSGRNMLVIFVLAGTVSHPTSHSMLSLFLSTKRMGSMLKSRTLRSLCTRLSRACRRTFSCSDSRASVHPAALLLLPPPPFCRNCASGGQTSPERNVADGVSVLEARLAVPSVGERGGGASRLVSRETVSVG